MRGERPRAPGQRAETPGGPGNASNPEWLRRKVNQVELDLEIQRLAREQMAVRLAGSEDFADQYLTPTQLRNLPRPSRSSTRSYPATPTRSSAAATTPSRPSSPSTGPSASPPASRGRATTSNSPRALHRRRRRPRPRQPRRRLGVRLGPRRRPPTCSPSAQTALNLHQPGPAFDHLLEHVTDRRLRPGHRRHPPPRLRRRRRQQLRDGPRRRQPRPHQASHRPTAPSSPSPTPTKATTTPAATPASKTTPTSSGPPSATRCSSPSSSPR